MSRPLVCDNPTCETLVRADDLDARTDADGFDVAGSFVLPEGWVTVSEIDVGGDDVTVGECCSRSCAAALLTMESAD